jgi:phage-related protein
MRNVDASTLAQLQARELRTFVLVDKEIGGDHYRWTDCQVPIPHDGELYHPKPFSVGSIRYSSRYVIDLARVSYANLDSLMTALYVGSDTQGEPTTVYLVTVDAAGHIIGAPITLFPGKIDEWGLDEEKLEETLRSRLARGDVCTLNRHSPSCVWHEFKGAECGYAGAATTCDRSYARCEALGNTANFGGDRWLPSIVNKDIWWGRVKA